MEDPRPKRRSWCSKMCTFIMIAVGLAFIATVIAAILLGVARGDFEGHSGDHATVVIAAERATPAPIIKVDTREVKNVANVQNVTNINAVTHTENVTIVETAANAQNATNLETDANTLDIMPSTFVSVIVSATTAAGLFTEETHLPKKRIYSSKKGPHFFNEDHYIAEMNDAAMGTANYIYESGTVSEWEDEDGGVNHPGCHAYNCRRKLHPDWKHGKDKNGKFHGLWNDIYVDKWLCYPGGCGDLPDCDPEFCDTVPAKFNDWNNGEKGFWGTGRRDGQSSSSSSSDSD